MVQTGRNKDATDIPFGATRFDANADVPVPDVVDPSTGCAANRRATAPRESQPAPLWRRHRHTRPLNNPCSHMP